MMLRQLNRTAAIWAIAAVLAFSCKAAIAFAQPAGQAKPDPAAAGPVGSPEEFHPRGGLPNFFRKIRPGKEVRIAYIGGSITEASDGWRDLTFSWFRSRFPQTAFQQINASIGGTGSNLGVFRMEQDVLSKDPDLIFVEFAVNDNGNDTAGIHRAMEGIVRKTWKRNPETEICFVYTIAENVVKPLREGRFQNSAVAMEQIAGHYGIPSIHMGVEVVRLLEAGKLVFTGNPEEHPGKIVFTRDRTHPLSASGHPIYANVVIRSFRQMMADHALRPHQLKAPFVRDNLENAQMVPLAKLKKKENWQELPAGHEVAAKFAAHMPYLYKAGGPGASFTVKFRGKTLGVYDVIGPNSGIIEVSVDGGAPVPVTRFDGWCNNYRKNAFFINDLEEGVHEVTFVVSAEPVDKEGILAKRNIRITDPASFRENSWFVYNVLLAGDLLE